MRQEINSSDRLILICSPRLVERAAQGRNNLVTEINHAHERQRSVAGFIVPIVLEGNYEIPRTIGDEATTDLSNLMCLQFANASYEDIMVTLEPLGLIPTLLGGSNFSTGQRATYQALLDTYLNQKLQICGFKNLYTS